MKDLAEILEDELARAVEVKDRESLHRYVLLMTEQHADQNSCDARTQELGSSIEKSIQSMREGFARMDDRFNHMQKQMDERFAQMDTRFEQMQKQMDERFAAQDRRFEDMNKRFDDMSDRFHGLQKLIGTGFAAMAFIITAFNLALLFS